MVGRLKLTRWLGLGCFVLGETMSKENFSIALLWCREKLFRLIAAILFALGCDLGSVRIQGPPGEVSLTRTRIGNP
jgi:hypothetical protein